MARSIGELRLALSDMADVVGGVFVTREEFEALQVEFYDLSDRVLVAGERIVALDISVGELQASVFPMGGSDGGGAVVVVPPDPGGPPDDGGGIVLPPDVDPDDPGLDRLGRRRFLLDDDVTMRNLQNKVDEVEASISGSASIALPPAPTSRGWAFGDGQLIIPDTISVVGIGASGSAKPVLVKTDRSRGFKAMLTVIATKERPRAVPCILRGLQLRSYAADDLDDIGVYVAGAVNFQATANEIVDFGRSQIELTAGTGNFGAKLGPHKAVIWANKLKCGINAGGNNGYGVAVNGMADHPWRVTPGGPRMVYVEANHILTPRHATASNFGARYVARHNIVEGQRKNAHTWDAHGASGWGNPRIGTRWVEIYRNIVLSNIAGLRSSNAGAGIRGGGGVVFENEFQNKIASFGGNVRVVVIRREKRGAANPEPWQTGWAGMLAPEDPGWTHQAYVWANTYRGQPAVPYVWPSDQDYFKRDVDYFQRPPAGYVPLAYPHPDRPDAVAA